MGKFGRSTSRGVSFGRGFGGGGSFRMSSGRSYGGGSSYRGGYSRGTYSSSRSYSPPAYDQGTMDALQANLAKRQAADAARLAGHKPGKPLGWGGTAQDLNNELGEGDHASVWDPTQPHQGHTDVTEYGKHGGRIYREGKLHINPDGSIRGK